MFVLVLVLVLVRGGARRAEGAAWRVAAQPSKPTAASHPHAQLCQPAILVAGQLQ